MGEVTQMKIRTLVLAYKQPQPVTGNTNYLIIVFTSPKYGQLDLFQMHSFMYDYALCKRRFRNGTFLHVNRNEYCLKLHPRRKLTKYIFLLLLLLHVTIPYKYPLLSLSIWINFLF